MDAPACTWMHLHERGRSRATPPPHQEAPPSAATAPGHPGTDKHPTRRRPQRGGKGGRTKEQKTHGRRRDKGRGFSNPWPFGPHRINPRLGGRHGRLGEEEIRGRGRRGRPGNERTGGCSVRLMRPGAQNKCFGNNGRPPQGQVPKTPCFVSSRGRALRQSHARACGCSRPSGAASAVKRKGHYAPSILVWPSRVAKSASMRTCTTLVSP